MEHGHGLPAGFFGSDSLAPHDRVSVEDEAARMSRGRGRQMWSILAVAALLGIAGIMVVRVMDAQQLRSDAYGAIRGADDEHAQQFLRCAMPDAQVTQIGNSATLLSLLERTGQRLGTRHGVLLGQCATELDELDYTVQHMQVPQDARDELEAVRVAVTELRRAFGAYHGYLIGGGTVENVNALPHMDKAATAWSTYVAKRKALENALLPPLQQR